MSRILELTSSNFERIIKSGKSIFVDFWAPSCKPCVRMEPVIERVAEKHDSMIFAKLNVEDNAEIATKYNISSLPSFVIFNNSYPMESTTGAVSEQELEDMIAQTHMIR